MATRNGNVKGIDIVFAPGGMGTPTGVCVAVVSFDLLAQAFTGGSDTIQLGGGGYDQGVATTQTLAQMIAARVRDGGTCTLLGVIGCGVGRPGYQAGTPLWAQAAAVSGGNVASLTLNTLPTGGSSQTTTNANWDAAATVAVAFQMSTDQ
jgi:hypothetical protein